MGKNAWHTARRLVAESSRGLRATSFNWQVFHMFGRFFESHVFQVVDACTPGLVECSRGLRATSSNGQVSHLSPKSLMHAFFVLAREGFGRHLVQLPILLHLMQSKSLMHAFLFSHPCSR